MSTFGEAALRRNPAWVQLLGLCPLLAVSNTVANAAGLAIASAVVLTGSAFFIASVRGGFRRMCGCPVSCWSSPPSPPSYTLRWRPTPSSLHQRIALFVQIVVTNCMILGQVERVAAKVRVGRALVDALGASAGFAAAILALGAVREVIAVGFPLAAMPAGAFVIAGLLLALANVLAARDWRFVLRRPARTDLQKKPLERQ